MTCLAALCLVAGTFTITDGDTFRTEAQAYRIWGIDAAELRDPGGFAAAAGLTAVIGGRDLACEVMDRDRFDRDVVRCATPDGADIACAMVAAGLARDRPRFSGGYYAGCAR